MFAKQINITAVYVRNKIERIKYININKFDCTFEKISK